MFVQGKNDRGRFFLRTLGHGYNYNGKNMIAESYANIRQGVWKLRAYIFDRRQAEAPEVAPSSKFKKSEQIFASLAKNKKHVLNALQA